MKIPTTTREDYLKAVWVLHQRTGAVRSVDLARYLGISKPSVSRAVSNLTAGGFLYMDSDSLLCLTDSGREIARNTYERHCFFTRQLLSMGVDLQTAEEDACKLEHAVSECSFRKIQAFLEPEAI